MVALADSSIIGVELNSLVSLDKPSPMVLNLNSSLREAEREVEGKVTVADVVVTEANMAAEEADGRYTPSSLSPIRSVLYGEALLPGLGLVGLFSMLEEVLMLLLRVEIPESYLPSSEYRIGEGLFTVLGDLGLFGLFGLLGLIIRGVARGLGPMSFDVRIDGVEGRLLVELGSRPVGVKEVFFARVASLGLPDRGELI